MLAALQTAKGFEPERDELNQLFPNTEAGSRAVDRYIEQGKYADVLKLAQRQQELNPEDESAQSAQNLANFF